MMRRFRSLLPVAALAVAAVGAAGCNTDDVLTVEPTTVVPASGAISDVVSARSATFGLYDALQSGSYYGESFYTFPELISDNARHRGTFSTYANAEAIQLTSENTTIGGIWTALYRSIGRANANIEALTAPKFVIAADEQEQYLGEAYLVRALSYHNLVKYWGGVPLVLKSIGTPAEASDVTRASVAEVYTQILADLDAAATHFAAGTGSTVRTRGNLLAARALKARVLFYRASAIPSGATADYNAAIAAATQVITGRSLAPSYKDLFDPRGNATTEDIWRVSFSDQDAGSVSYYYMDKSLGGRRELGPNDNTADPSRITASYETGDVRRAATLGAVGTRNYVSKFPSVTGTEHLHIIRLAEVYLIRAESYARTGDLASATADLNVVRARAGLGAKVLGTPGYTTAAEVISTIIHERRIELAFEGDRWADMLRTGEAAAYLTFKGAPATEALFPIPQTELDVWNNSGQQNPGY